MNRQTHIDTKKSSVFTQMTILQWEWYKTKLGQTALILLNYNYGPTRRLGVNVTIRPHSTLLPHTQRACCACCKEDMEPESSLIWHPESELWRFPCYLVTVVFTIKSWSAQFNLCKSTSHSLLTVRSHYGRTNGSHPLRSQTTLGGTSVIAIHPGTELLRAEQVVHAHYGPYPLRIELPACTT